MIRRTNIFRITFVLRRNVHSTHRGREMGRGANKNFKYYSTNFKKKENVYQWTITEEKVYYKAA